MYQYTKISHNIISRLAIYVERKPTSLYEKMVEPKKYINNVVKFERQLTIKDYEELSKAYTILPKLTSE